MLFTRGALLRAVSLRRGRTILHPDLSIPERRIAFEHEGDGHRVDRRQWHLDIERRDVLESEGWRVVRVTAHDLFGNRDAFRRISGLVGEGDALGAGVAAVDAVDDVGEVGEDDVRWPLASVRSVARMTNLRTLSARDTPWFAVSIARWISALTAGLTEASARVMSLSSPLFASQVGSISVSSVMSAAMNGFWSPTTITWLTSGLARIGSSSAAGETFLPPAVTMISFLRPVIVK